MKKLFMTASVLGILFFLAACGGDTDGGDTGEESAGETFSISYSTWANEGEPAYQGMQRLQEIVEEETDGNVTVELYPGNQMGSTVEQMEQVKLGTLEMMSSGDPGMDEIEYLSLPYLMDSNEHWTHVLESDLGQSWNDQLIEEQGVRTIGTLARGPRVVSSNEEIHSPEDMNGLKIRAPAVDYYVNTFEALGANPTPMDMGEVYNGLQTGVVDAQENPLETIHAGGLYEVQEYVINTNHMYKPAFVTINEEFFQSMPEEYQDILLEAAEEGEMYAQEQLEANAEEMVSEMEDNGVTFIDPDIAPFEEATQSVRDELGIQVWGEEDYNEVVEMGQADLE